MSIAPRGSSIQEAYTWYRKDKKFWVNRRYQRKLVWTVDEKQKLIDSILLGYPLPLILLAENKNSQYEIIDGMQRLNAIFTFIETSYPRKDNKYFDLNEFVTAKLEGEKGSFKPKKLSSSEKISREDCAKIMNYQLAITVFPADDETKINEVFSRINSSGRQLSNQEKRQAGVVSRFSDLVRDISSEIRGDVSYKTLALFNMPVISIDTKKESHGYKISAEDTLWCHHGILSTKQMRQSDDEEMIADILVSILLETPFDRSKQKLDALYSNTKEANNIETKLKQYDSKKLKREIKTLFDLINKIVRKESKIPKTLQKTIMGKKSSVQSIKASFYALFMAFYDLVIKESQYPADEKKILKALKGVHNTLRIQTKHITSDERQKNINQLKGLIQSHFVKTEPTQILHGPSLEIDLENSLRRSKVETPHYEFKQGFLTLDSSRKFDKKLIRKLAETACGMANIGPEREGYIHIGVADRLEHANKIKKTDSITPIKINGFQVVGIDREAKLQKKTIEKYVDFFVSEFKKTKLSEHLKSSILKNMDTIKYRGLSVIRLKIESQAKISYVDDQCFLREHNHTKLANGPQIEAIINRFHSAKKNKLSKRKSTNKTRTGKK